MYLRATLAVTLFGVSLARAVEKIPIEAFARPATLSALTMAPDGKTYGFLRNFEEHRTLFLAGVGSREPQRVNVGVGDQIHRKRDVEWYMWIGPNRLVTSLGYDGLIEGLAAFDRDANNWQALSGIVGYDLIRVSAAPEPLYAYRVLHNFGNDRDVLLLDLHVPSGPERSYPDVVFVNTRTKTTTRAVKNPGHVTSWLTDGDGVVRGAIQDVDRKDTLLCRANEKSPWESVLDLNDGDSVPLGFSADGRGIYIQKYGAEGFRALYRFDVGKRELGEALFALPGYDIEFDGSGSSMRLIWSSGKKRAAIGYRYVAEKPGLVCFDDGLARQMAAIDRALPDTFNEPVQFSDDGHFMLVKASSDREAGVYYRFEAASAQLTRLGRELPDLKPEDMAPMRPFEYKARDGTAIHGYLTLPVGIAPRDLPLVVMPHATPWGRDIWEFNSMVQMLANRGYAVMQMNVRGSGGYGQAFLAKGSREISGAVQHDIEDAIRGATAHHLADPSRVAIMGSYCGGFAALTGAAKSPDLYRCAIAINGITDWVPFFHTLRTYATDQGYEEWTETVGDPDKDKQALQAMSPVNFAGEIRVPVLLIHGKDEYLVAPEQSEHMAAALTDAGNRPETLLLAAERSFSTEKGRLACFRAVESFLAQHMAAEKPDAKP